jgi:hypothetical protein
MTKGNVMNNNNDQANANQGSGEKQQFVCDDCKSTSRGVCDTLRGMG